MGQTTVTTSPTRLKLSAGACVAQSLSSEIIQAMRGRNYTLQCQATKPFESTGYADMVLGLDGVELIDSTVDRSTSITGGAATTAFTISGKASENITNGYIGLYSELQDDEYLSVFNCALIIQDESPATINVDYNLTGYDKWIKPPSGFENRISVTNTSSETLFNVNVSSRENSDCAFYYADLEAGATKIEFCEPVSDFVPINTHGSRVVSNFIDVVTATAETTDNNVVTGSDETHVTEGGARGDVPYAQIAVETNQNSVAVGDELSLIVHVASTGSSPSGAVESIDSNFDNCDNTFDPVLPHNTLTYPVIGTYGCSVIVSDLPTKINLQIKTISGNSYAERYATIEIFESGVVVINNHL